MKWATTISIAVLVTALLSGCAARSLSVLQAEFNAAVETRAACDTKVVYEPTAASNCSVDYRTIFADIATQAEKSLQKYRGGTAVKIGLHRLHAYSLWQSGATEKTIAQAARKGLTVCAGENYAKAPRDCALLATIGGLKGVEAIGTDIEEIYEKLVNTEDKTAACTRDVEGWREIAADYWHNYYLPLAKDMNICAARAETPDGVLQYLKKQQRAAYEQLQKLKNMGRQCVTDDAVAQVLIACPCNPELRTNEDQEACRNVFDADNPAHAFYFDTFCMHKSINMSNECPCGDGGQQNLTDEEKRACDYVKSNPDAKTLYEAKCRVEQALE
jgi:hypothetical protein